MPRVISFLVLLAIVLLVGAVFYRVMAQFLVPLFLACVLLVVFQPLHVWIRGRLPRYPRISALITTILIVLAVVLPLVWVGWNAFRELHALLWPAGVEVALAEPPPEADPEAVPPPDTTWLDVVFDLRDRLGDATGVTIDDATVRGTVDRIPRVAANITLNVLRHTVGILFGLVIIVIALYYFLADGPEMIRTVMHFSPLNPDYERELLSRFSEVSRAVVLATLLTAAVQGVLAGVGFFFALPATAPIFLLVAATMLTALVPFIGAAVVWIPACIWVYFYGPRFVEGEAVQGDPLTAIVLAVYCAVLVSGVDNVIKPMVLHGQSRLHPLLALLSIIGGVTVLGPVGILVGPMLVSFLQALLTMLRKELDLFDAEASTVALPGDTSRPTPAAETELKLSTQPAAGKVDPPPADGLRPPQAQAAKPTSKNRRR